MLIFRVGSASLCEVFCDRKSDHDVMKVDQGPVIDVNSVTNTLLTLTKHPLISMILLTTIEIAEYLR